MTQHFPLRLFKYTVQQRGEHWVVRCMQPGDGYEPFEMAPTFKSVVTAVEIAEKASRGDEYTTSIPCVPYGDAIPRTPNLVFAPGRHEKAGPGNACPRCGK